MFRVFLSFAAMLLDVVAYVALVHLLASDLPLWTAAILGVTLWVVNMVGKVAVADAD